MGGVAAVIVVDGCGVSAVAESVVRAAAALRHPEISSMFIVGRPGGDVTGSVGFVASSGPADLAERIDAETLLLHDAAGPPPVAAVVDAVLAALADGPTAVVPVTPMPDTVKIVGADGFVIGGENRDDLRVWQWPWGVRRDWLAGAAGPWSEWLSGVRVPEGAVLVDGAAPDRPADESR